MFTAIEDTKVNMAEQFRPRVDCQTRAKLTKSMHLDSPFVLLEEFLGLARIVEP